MNAQAHAHPPTSTGLDTWKLGFWTFLGSETLFFGSFIATYMIYAGRSVQGPLPHEILDIPLTSVSTFVLLFSSFAMVLGLAGVQQNRRFMALLWIGMTAFMGMVFLAFQAYEFTHFYHEGLTLSSNLFGSSFFILTGFHGAHVTIGVIWLLMLWLQLFAGRIGPADSLKVEIAGLYWHFVDIVWIVIFTLIYLLSDI